MGGAWGGRIVRERDKVKEASSLASASAFLCLFTIFILTQVAVSVCATQKTRTSYVLPLCSLCASFLKTMIQSRQDGYRNVEAVPVCDKRQQAT